MSVNAKRNAALVVLGGAAALTGLNFYVKPYTSTHRGPVYNANPHPEQDRGDTIFDRTKLLNDVKSKKPWNMTAAERERAGH